MLQALLIIMTKLEIDIGGQTRGLNGCWKFDNEMPFRRSE